VVSEKRICGEGKDMSVNNELGVNLCEFTYNKFSLQWPVANSRFQRSTRQVPTNHTDPQAPGELGPLSGDCRLLAGEEEDDEEEEFRRSKPAWFSTTALSAHAICPCLVPYTTPAPGKGWNSATLASSSSKWLVRLVRVPIRRMSPSRHTAATGCCQGSPLPSPRLCTRSRARGM